MIPVDLQQELFRAGDFRSLPIDIGSLRPLVLTDEPSVHAELESVQLRADREGGDLDGQCVVSAARRGGRSTSVCPMLTSTDLT
jgi:hypothetical protein